MCILNKRRQPIDRLYKTYIYTSYRYQVILRYITTVKRPTRKRRIETGRRASNKLYTFLVKKRLNYV